MAYHQANIQTKIDDITKEMERLRTETEMADVHSEPRMALESRHDALLNTVHYNLAKEHVRSGSSPGDVKKSTLAIISTNKKMEKEIDAIFIKRNKVHDEISRVEAEVAEIHAVMESKILDGDDELREDLRDVLSTVKAVIAETEQHEDDIVLIRHKLRAMELETTRAEKLMGGSEKAYKRLLKKDNLCKQHLEQLREITRQLGDERCLLLSTVKTLRDDVSKKEEWILNVKLPSKEEMELMKNDVAFTKKHLDVNRETIAILHQEKKKRTNEDLLKLQESRTDHGSVKAECLRLMDKINRGIISNLN
ncbi:hypothetical protein ACHAXA_008695 [Cyclostephanos tholiformis]|uniref:Uncharacterized protein n=1 Tax=Cyclostephanos tholiformis TaxID=382380 RepID=A0ABD3R4I1_9STRA